MAWVSVNITEKLWLTLPWDSPAHYQTQKFI